MNKSKSFNLFLISAVIISLTILIATFWNALGFGTNKTPLAISIIITFGISIAGIIFGINELKQVKNRKLWFGIIGNILVIVFFVFMIIYSLKK